MLAKLWVWLIWLLDPDRIYKVSAYVFLFLALLLLLTVILGGGNTPRWQGWHVYDGGP